MAILDTFKQAQYGEELNAYANQGQKAIDTLTTLRTAIPNLKTTIGADTDLTAAQITAAQAEVDTVAADLIQQIKTFANGL